MRTSIFILALAVHDVAVTQGAKQLDFGFWGWFFVIFLVMDVFDFLAKKR